MAEKTERPKKTVRSVMEKYLYQTGVCIFIIGGLYFYFKGDNNGLKAVNALEVQNLADCKETVQRLEKRIKTSDSATAVLTSDFQKFIFNNFNNLKK